ncbi:MAG: hypothetical protein IJN80_08255 [Clostridia bacterium]|nr:hypothetical protein [Clostridia bacterium]
MQKAGKFDHRAKVGLIAQEGGKGISSPCAKGLHEAAKIGPAFFRRGLIDGLQQPAKV